MTQSIARAFRFLPGLAFILLQACGGDASSPGANDPEAAHDELGAEEEGAAPECAIPAVCQLCDDGSCATPHVEVVNGECSPVTYTCDSAPVGNGNTSSDEASSPGNAGPTTSSSPASSPPSEPNCALPAICQLCEDGTCATPEVEYNDGVCGAVHFVCPASVEGSTGADAGVSDGAYAQE